MATATATRRLAAILVADVEGYSRLMRADEEGTHERFKAHLPQFAPSGGMAREHLFPVSCAGGQPRPTVVRRGLTGVRVRVCR